MSSLSLASSGPCTKAIWLCSSMSDPSWRCWSAVWRCFYPCSRACAAVRHGGAKLVLPRPFSRYHSATPFAKKKKKKKKKKKSEEKTDT
eukprot:NODE_17038_length_964_cov_6.579450.p3 GENE.NODE_17038_length_964_cov_6.579450~~NODE_17038_length_964_cov_6.579450.p3  ORF type:complete len:89 (+),score=17.29 NODE_17038_length_964_cov_6.579450:650-916(+)